MMNRGGRDRTGRAGEHYVAAEVNRRGAYAAPWAGNLPDIAVVAVAMDGERSFTAYIQVKTKGPKQSTWQGDVRVGWDLPKSDEIECVSWGGCQPTYLCQQPKHKHGDLSVSPHDNSIDLKDQREVPGRDEHCWVLWRWKTCPMPRAIG